MPDLYASCRGWCFAPDDRVPCVILPRILGIEPEGFEPGGRSVPALSSRNPMIEWLGWKNTENITWLTWTRYSTESQSTLRKKSPSIT